MRHLLLIPILLVALGASAAPAHAKGLVTVTVKGSGHVSGPGGGCDSPARTPDTVVVPCGSFSGDDCSMQSSPNPDGHGTTTIETCRARLGISAPSGWRFTGWSGACTGTGGCNVVTYVRVCDTSQKPPCGRPEEEPLPPPAVTANFDDVKAPVVTLSGTDEELFMNADGRRTVSWSVSEPDEQPALTCTLDGTKYDPCVPGDTALTGLRDGLRTFAVTATDPSGNTQTYTRTWDQQIPASAAFTDAPAEGAHVPSGAPRVAFTSAKAGVSFQCRLDDGNWSGCSSPADLAALADGAHSFAVRALFADHTGLLHTGEPVSRSWTVDTVAPDTTLGGGPPAGGLTSDRGAVFQLISDPEATYQCSLDGASFAACPATVTLTGLAPGAHVFRARAIDLAGNVDATAAERAWRISADADGDGTLVPDDCDDANPRIHPGAPEIPRNHVDEDCDGRDGDYLPLSAEVSHGWVHAGRFTRLPRLIVKAPAGSLVTLRCHGGGCKIKTKRLVVGPKPLKLSAFFKHARLAPGATVEVAVTAHERYGKRVRLTMRHHGGPKVAVGRITPGH
jgi:hypothetical protein